MFDNKADERKYLLFVASRNGLGFRTRLMAIEGWPVNRE